MPLPGLNYGRALASAAGAAQNQRHALATLIGVWGGGRDYRTSGGGTDYRVAAAQKAAAEQEQYAQEQADKFAKDELDFEQQKALQGSAFENQSALEALKQTGREGLLGERLASAEERQRAALEAQAAKNAASVQAQQAAAAERERQSNEKRRAAEQVRLSKPAGQTETAGRLRELAARVLPGSLNAVAQAVVASPKEMEKRKADIEKQRVSGQRESLQRMKYEAARADAEWRKGRAERNDAETRLARKQNVYATTLRTLIRESGNWDSPYHGASQSDLEKVAEGIANDVIGWGTDEAPPGGGTTTPAPGGAAPPTPAATPEISPATAQSLAEIAVMDPEEAWQEAQEIQKYIDEGHEPQDGVDLQRVVAALKSRWNTSMGPDEPFGVEEEPEAAAPTPAPAPEASFVGVNNTMGNQALDAVQAAQNAPGAAIDAVGMPAVFAAGPIGVLAGSGHLAGKAMGAVGGGVMNALTGSSSFGEMGGKMFADEQGNQSAAGRAAGMALDALAALLPVARGMRVKTGGGVGPLRAAPTPRRPGAVPPGRPQGPPRPGSGPTVEGQAVNPTPPEPPPQAAPPPGPDPRRFAEAKAKAAQALRGVPDADLKNQMNKTSAARQAAQRGTRERAIAEAQLQALIDEYNRRTGKSYKMPN